MRRFTVGRGSAWFATTMLLAVALAGIAAIVGALVARDSLDGAMAALAWQRARTGASEPLRLVSRAGLLTAGIGAAWSLQHMVATERLLALEVLIAWVRLPLVTLGAPVCGRPRRRLRPDARSRRIHQ